MEPSTLQTPIPPDNKLIAKEEVLQRADPIALDIDDKKLVEVIDKRMKDSKDFFTKEYNLFERRKKNEEYLFGRQVLNKEKKNELKIYESRYLDNINYEIEASIKPLAMSRLPDLMVTPGVQGDEQKQMAEDIGKVVNTQTKSRENRIALGIAFKHLPVYFTGVIKCIWDAKRNEYRFIPVHPDYIEVDHTCQSNNADEMSFVSEICPTSIQECFIRFPDKKEELTRELQADSILPVSESGEFSQKDLATIIKIRLIWFDWIEPKKKDSPDEGQEFDEINGVMWKYKRCILKKERNVNYDWKGEKKTYTYDDPADETTKRPVGEQDMFQYLLSGQVPPNMMSEQVFKNYFDVPRKPYFFMGYDQWHKIPYDETSRLEQNLNNQMSNDDTGKRIMDKLKSRRKHVFSKEGGMNAAVLERLDLDDPRQDLLVNGEPNKQHAAIEPEIPTAPEFQYLNETRDRMYGVAGATAIRGQQQSDTATTNQIAREADYTRADDLVEDTINAASEWMAEWSLQMIKLRYDEYHYKRILGARGSTTFIKLRGDMVDDGMEVVIKSSGTDKIRIKNQAMDMAKLQLIDPLNFYRDIGVDDPEGRTEALLTLQTNPSEYLARFVLNLGDTPAQMGALLNGTPGVPPGGPPPMQPVPTQAPSAGPTPLNTGQVATEPPQGVSAAPSNGIL